jgi:hypothetical protein
LIDDDERQAEAAREQTNRRRHAKFIERIRERVGASRPALLSS